MTNSASASIYDGAFDEPVLAKLAHQMSQLLDQTAALISAFGPKIFV